MIDYYYQLALFTTGIVLLFMGSYLCFNIIPQKPIFKDYNQARIPLGIAFIMWGFEMLVLWKFDFRLTNPPLATIINMATYFAGELLIWSSLMTLLSNTYRKNKKKSPNLVRYLFMILLLIIVLAVNNKTYKMALLIIAAIYLFIETARLVYIFYSTYHKAIQKVQNYYYDNVDHFANWMSKSCFFAIIPSLMGSILAFAPQWANGIYTVVGLVVFVYIFVSFQNYLVHFEELQLALDEPDDTELVLQKTGQQLNQQTSSTNKLQTEGAQKPTGISNKNNKVYRQLYRAIEKWKKEHGYIQEGITIASLANILGTNRTYLSEYINSTYNCTFRSWINQLRIEEAKQLLINQPNKTIELISQEVGYSTSSHFIHIFTDLEKCTPFEWRKKHDAA